MKNLIPKTIPELLTLAGVATIGVGEYGAATFILQNTQPRINADIQALTDAILAYGNGRTELKTRRETVRSTARTARVLLMLGRDSLKPDLGSQFNEAWLPLGHNGTLEVTEDAAQLLHLLRSYKEFLESQATFELPTKDFTAIHLQTLFTQLEAAVGAVNIQEAVVGDLMDERDNKAEKLRKRLRGLIEELTQNIDPLDQRWKAFGFNMPGALETPEAPEGVQVILIGPNAAAMKWEASSRADYYRVWQKVHGTEGDPVAVGSPADLDFTLENLPTGTSLDIAVSAVNNGGESALSKVVTITTH